MTYRHPSLFTKLTSEDKTIKDNNKKKALRLQEQQRSHGVMWRATSIALGLVLVYASLPVVRALSNASHIVLFCGSSVLVKGLQTEVKVSDICQFGPSFVRTCLCVINLNVFM